MLLNFLHGLSRPGDNCDHTLKKHLLKNVGMNACVSDPFILYKHLWKQLIRLFDTHVDGT